MPDNNKANELNLEPEEENQEQTGSTEGTDEAQGEAPEDESLVFVDESQVPPELQPILKQMKAGLTKKFQALAKDRQAFAEASHKATLFDQLLADPRIQTVLAKADQEEFQGEDSEVAPEVEAAVKRALSPVEQKLMQLEIAREKEAFVTRHPSWEKYSPGMQEAWRQNPALSMEEAYSLAVYKSLVTKQKATTKQTRASTETSGASSGETDDKVDTFEDAARAALRELKMQPQQLRGRSWS